MVPAARRDSRWLTTSRTLSGVPNSRQRPGHPHLPTGDLDYSRLYDRAPELADEEGVAGGEIVDRGRKLVQLGVVRGRFRRHG